MLGYDGMVIRWEGRDDAMQYAWTAEKAYQFRWHPSAVLSANRSEILCHISEETQAPPPQLDFRGYQIF